jgi:hypothetical protein
LIRHHVRDRGTAAAGDWMRRSMDRLSMDRLLAKSFKPAETAAQAAAMRLELSARYEPVRTKPACS